VQYSIDFFYNQTEAADDVISDRFVQLIVPDKPVKLRDNRLNHSPEIRRKPSDWPFGRFFAITFDQKYLQAANRVMSGVTVD